ncbi:MAG: extracellular solute-binding protein [Actinomycetota bacterium]
MRRGLRLPGFRLCLVALAVALVASACTPGGDDGGEEGDGVTLTILTNAVRGGKNAATAEWFAEYVIPNFEEQMADEGTDVTVRLEETGVDDEDYKARIALDLRAGEGADILGFDQFWVAEFVAAGYLEPLSESVGDEVEDWEGWDQIPEAVQGSLELDGERYGIPLGTDGRVLFYNKDLFRQAGLPAEWRPESWDDIIEAGRTLKEELPDVTPLQINAGISAGEATTLQGFVPILNGTGTAMYDEEAGQWVGDTPELRATLEFYDTIYSEGLADAQLQQRADGRDRSFQEFSQGQIAVLAESDYFWRDVVAPDGELFPMKNRDEVVGYTKIPAQEPGAGVNGQDFVSASGGTGHVLNSNTENPEEAWALLSFMGSEESMLDFVEREPRITAREDVNEQVLDEDPLLQFISEETLPITWYRPGFEEYPQVSVAVTEMLEGLVAGRFSVDEAAAEYTAQLEDIAEGEVLTE